MRDLVRSDQSGDNSAEELRARVAELEAVFADRSAEVARLDADLAAFRIRYRQEVGFLHEQLDELEQAIEEAERGEFARQVKDGSREAPPPPAGTRSEPAPRFTSDAVRKLFRDVARTVHPDLARDDHTRERRHALMIEANRAYAVGDEDRLRSILRAWERSPEAVLGSNEDATRLRLARRIAQIEEELTAYAAELADLKESPLWKLKIMVDDAAARGKDLVSEMVRRLKRDILVAGNRLDAIRPQK